MAGVNTDGMTHLPPASATGFETFPADTNPTVAAGAGSFPLTAAISLAALAFILTATPGAAVTITAATATTGTVTSNTQKTTLTSPTVSIPPGGTYTLTWTNSLQIANSRLLLELQNGTATAVLPFNQQPSLQVTSITLSVGSAVIVMTNNSPTATVSGTFVLYGVVL
jgi:hypothetical protein